MRGLIMDGRPVSDPEGLDEEALTRWYAVPRTPWFRVNMVSTVDGAATGESGNSGSINNPADKRVFDVLRASADAIVVGAGTARTEGYRPTDRPIVLVSRSGQVPPGLRGAAPGSVLLATCEAADGLVEARGLLGEEHVLVLGGHRVDLRALQDRLAERGLLSLLSEGGPHLLRDLLSTGVVDELDSTIVPLLVGGSHARITDGPPVDVPLRLHALLEAEGTLLARWFVADAGLPGQPRPEE